MHLFGNFLDYIKEKKPRLLLQHRKKNLKTANQRGPSVSEINWDKQKSVFKEL